jgi:hypothetical protein
MLALFLLLSAVAGVQLRLWGKNPSQQRTHTHTRTHARTHTRNTPDRGQVRKPTNVVSTICDDRGEEPTYAGARGCRSARFARCGAAVNVNMHALPPAVHRKHAHRVCVCVCGKHPGHSQSVTHLVIHVTGVSMSELIEGDYGVAGVVSLLWFKRSLPKYATKFMEM